MHRSTASSLFLMALALILLASPLAAGKMKGWELLGERQVTDGLDHGDRIEVQVHAIRPSWWRARFTAGSATP